MQLGVIAGGEGGQGNLVVTGGFAQGTGLFSNNLGVLFPDGTVDKPGLTKTASPDTSPENFGHGPVVDHLDVGDHKLVGIIGGTHVLHNAFCHLGMGAWIEITFARSRCLLSLSLLSLIHIYTDARAGSEMGNEIWNARLFE